MKNLLLLLVLMILCIGTTAYSNELFTSNEGLAQSKIAAKAILGDSLQLYQVQCCPDRNDSMGYCLEWKYTYCNSDTCAEIVVTKLNNEYKAYGHYLINYFNYYAIGAPSINSDEAYIRATECFNQYPNCYVNGYLFYLDDYENYHFIWLFSMNNNYANAGNCSGEPILYDCMLGHCQWGGTNINDKPISNNNIQEIFWDYLNDEIVINPMNNDINRINQIEVIDILGNCKVKLSDIDNINLNISTRDWFSGVYYCIVKSGKNIRTVKFVVVH